MTDNDRTFDSCSVAAASAEEAVVILSSESEDEEQAREEVRRRERQKRRQLQSRKRQRNKSGQQLHTDSGGECHEPRAKVANQEPEAVCVTFSDSDGEPVRRYGDSYTSSPTATTTSSIKRYDDRN